jgi:hypothetical protein
VGEFFGCDEVWKGGAIMGMAFKPGRYRCVVDKQGWTESKEKKLPMIVFEVIPQVRLIAGPEGTDEEEVNPENWTRTVRVVINSDNEVGLDYSMKKLRYNGFEGTSFSQLDFTGKEVECICKPNTFNGKEGENWDLALPPLDQGPPPAPLDAAAARKFDTLFGKRLKDGASKKPAPQPQPAATGGGNPPPDDEVPF